MLSQFDVLEAFDNLYHISLQVFNQHFSEAVELVIDGGVEIAGQPQTAKTSNH